VDASRQWVKTAKQARPDHWKRYELASRYASGRVLDAACGCGYGSKMLLSSGQLVVGVDSNTSAINWAEEHFQGPYFIHGSIEEEPWTGRFETVVSLETIEHLRDPRVALQAFRRACVGTLIASVPNEDHYPFIAENFARDDSPHFRHYRPMEFEELLKECGFKVTERFCQKDKQGEIHAGSDGMFIVVVAE
jgi:2-polyprenyl-3-methyl-5-hydroxy-6-metoxy-1,4-benzoquinol methylase